MNLEKFYINGSWVDPIKKETIDIINPANESIVGQLSVGSAEDVDKAVKAARAAFSSFSESSVKERLDLLTTIRNIYKKRFDDIAEAIMTEMGAPINLARGAQAMVEGGKRQRESGCSEMLQAILLLAANMRLNSADAYHLY